MAREDKRGSPGAGSIRRVAHQEPGRGQRMVPPLLPIHDFDRFNHKKKQPSRAAADQPVW